MLKEVIQNSYVGLLRNIRIPNSWHRLFLEEFVVGQLVKNSLGFVEPEGPSPCSQTSATFPYP